MSRVTKQQIYDKVEYLQEKTAVPLETSHSAQGWYLVDARTFDRLGPICNTNGEFHRYLRGVDYGIQLGKDRDTLAEMSENRDDVSVELV